MRSAFPMTLVAAAVLVGCATWDRGGEDIAETEPLAEIDCGTLVPIEAEDMATGAAQERRWLEENHPGAVIVNQSFERCSGVPVERVVFVADGVQQVVVFDISSFFGKVEGDDLDSLLAG